MVPKFNSLAPGKLGCHFKTAIFNLVLLIGIFISFKDNAHRWMPWDLTDDKSTLVQVMASCRQATSHYLSQCWPSSMTPYGITRPQWVNALGSEVCFNSLAPGRWSNFKSVISRTIFQIMLMNISGEIALRWNSDSGKHPNEFRSPHIFCVKLAATMFTTWYLHFSCIFGICIIGKLIFLPILLLKDDGSGQLWDMGPLLLTWFNFNPSMDK